MATRSLDLDAMRTFVLGLQLGSFAKAASRVGRTPSAVSEQMTRLEVQAGKRLLRRKGRGLEPTEAGEIMLNYGRRLLDLNDEALAAVRGADLHGWVRLGLPQDFSERWLPDVLGRFARQHPRVRIEVRSDHSGEMIEQVETGRLDLALVWGEPKGDLSEILARLPIRWIGSADVDVHWNSGESVPLVVFEPPCRFRAAGIAALDASGIALRLAFTSPSLAGLWAAVAAGLGYSLRTPAGLPGSVRMMDSARLGLPELPSVALSLKQAKGDPPPAVALLTSVLRETLDDALDPFLAPAGMLAGSRPAEFHRRREQLPV